VDVEEVRRVSFRKNRLKLRRRRIEEAARPPETAKEIVTGGWESLPVSGWLHDDREYQIKRERERTDIVRLQQQVLWLRRFHLFEVLEEEN
jgi:hypothetical protein